MHLARSDNKRRDAENCRERSIKPRRQGSAQPALSRRGEIKREGTGDREQHGCRHEKIVHGMRAEGLSQSAKMGRDTLLRIIIIQNFAMRGDTGAFQGWFAVSTRRSTCLGTNEVLTMQTARLKRAANDQTMLREAGMRKREAG